MPRKGQRQSQETRERIRLSKLGSKNPSWKGGKHITKNGYIMIKRPMHPRRNFLGYVMEHRIVFEEHYKCCLLDWIVIHHINRNKQDNRIDNLQPMFRHDHDKLTKFASDIICNNCGDNKTYVRTDTGRICWFDVNDKILCRKCYRKTIEWPRKKIRMKTK